MYDLQPYLKTIDEVIARGPYRDTWESLSTYQVPEWYRNAKFGIFVHWGIFSVPAFGNEWYPRNMYIQDSPEYEHHIKTYGPHKDFGYKDFIPMFRESALIRSNGRICSRKREPGMWFRLRNFMMDSRCIKVKYLTGMPMRWDRSGMCWERSAQAVRSEEWHWVHPVTGLSIGFLWERGRSLTAMSRILWNGAIFTGPQCREAIHRIFIASRNRRRSLCRIGWYVPAN